MTIKRELPLRDFPFAYIADNFARYVVNLADNCI
jgi:hypothetical protein